MKKRQKQVALEIQKLLSTVLLRGFREPFSGFITLSNVEVSPDLSLATISYSVFNADESEISAKRLFELEKGRLRKIVGQSIRLRITPELRFIEDLPYQSAQKVHDLLADIRRKENP